MLILTRKEHETVTLGDDIRVTVIGIKGKQVRLGITAPDDVEVNRKEVYDKVQKEKQKKTAPDNQPSVPGQASITPAGDTIYYIDADSPEGKLLNLLAPALQTYEEQYFMIESE
jgi:carbon storage regulator